MIGVSGMTLTTTKENIMKNETGKSKVETAYGKPQPKDQQNYEYSYRVFEVVDEAAAAGYNFLELSNAAEKSNARANAYQKAIAWAKPDPNSPEFLKESMITTLMKMQNLGRAEAEALVVNLQKMKPATK